MIGTRNHLGRILRGHGDAITKQERTIPPGPPAKVLEDLPWFRFKGSAGVQYHAEVEGDPSQTIVAGMVVWDDRDDTISAGGWELVDAVAAMATRPAPFDTDLTPVALLDGIGGAGTGLVPPLAAGQVFAAHVSVRPPSGVTVVTIPLGHGGLFQGPDVTERYFTFAGLGTHALLTGWAPFCCFAVATIPTDDFDLSLTIPVTALLTRLLHFDHYT